MKNLFFAIVLEALYQQTALHYARPRSIGPVLPLHMQEMASWTIKLVPPDRSQWLYDVASKNPMYPLGETEAEFVMRWGRWWSTQQYRGVVRAWWLPDDDDLVLVFEVTR